MQGSTITVNSYTTTGIVAAQGSGITEASMGASEGNIVLNYQYPSIKDTISTTYPFTQLTAQLNQNTNSSNYQVPQVAYNLYNTFESTQYTAALGYVSALGNLTFTTTDTNSTSTQYNCPGVGFAQIFLSGDTITNIIWWCKWYGY